MTCVTDLYLPQQAGSGGEEWDVGNPDTLRQHCASKSLRVVGLLVRSPPKPMCWITAWHMHVAVQLEKEWPDSVVWVYNDYSLDGSPASPEHGVFQISKAGLRMVGQCDAVGMHHCCTVAQNSDDYAVAAMIQPVSLHFVTKRYSCGARRDYVRTHTREGGAVLVTRFPVPRRTSAVLSGQSKI